MAAGPALGSPWVWVRKPIRFAVVGVQGMGRANRLNAANFGEIVALCDVDQGRLSEAMADHPRAAAFADYRVMIDRMARDIDAVVVSTPDHTHAGPSMMAMERDLHVYCEKPLTRTVWEAREMGRLAGRRRLVTQMGNQGTAATSLRRTAKLVKEGLIGEVQTVFCWTDRAGGYWPQGIARPADGEVPKALAWDLWLGPAPERPYAAGYHAFAWRGWWDFGTGSLGDMGCHVMNLPFHALDLRDPLWVEAETSGTNGDSFPTWSVVRYGFGERRGRAGLELVWMDGGKRPDATVAPGVTFGGNGCVMVGSTGTLYIEDTYGNGARLLDGRALPETSVVESPGHWAEFARAIEGHASGGDWTQPGSAFGDAAAAFTETVLLGNLAVWSGGARVEWDARRSRARVRRGGGAEALERLVRPQYREGWMW